MTTRTTRDSYVFPVQTITQAQFDAFSAQKITVQDRITTLKNALIAGITDAVYSYDYQAATYPGMELNTALRDLEYLDSQLAKPIQG